MAENPSANTSTSSNTHLLESSGCTKMQFVKVRYTWKIQNFSFCCSSMNQGIRSSKFPSENTNNYGLKWYLKMHKVGEIMGAKIILMYLKLASSNVSAVQAEYKFAFANSKGEAVNTWKGSNRFEQKPTKNSRGFNVKVTNDLVVNNVLTVFCEITIPACYVNVSDEFATPKYQLADDLQGMFENQEFSDVTFSVQGREFRAHKVILAARSPVFKAMFGHEMVENQNNRVEITDIGYDVLREVMRFIYAEKVLNLDKISKELLAAADKYALEKLKVMCENVLCLNMSIENAAEMFVFADTYNAAKLKVQAREYINKHAMDISKTDGWKLMIVTRPQLLAEAFLALATQQGSIESPSKRRKLK